jgi:membrane protease YdiL (CAAX protease family)
VKTVKTVPKTTIALMVVPLGLWALLLLTLPYSSWLSLLLKVVLFGIPAYLFPRLVDGVDSNRYLLLNKAPSVGWICLSGVFLALYAHFVDRGQSGSVSVFFVVAAIVVSPLVEEMMFRGLVLQKLNRLLPFTFSNLATSLLFLVFHFPVWIVRGQSISFLGSLWVVFVSLCLGYFLRRSRSLWTCVIIHALQNLFITVL